MLLLTAGLKHLAAMFITSPDIDTVLSTPLKIVGISEISSLF